MGSLWLSPMVFWSGQHNPTLTMLNYFVAEAKVQYAASPNKTTLNNLFFWQLLNNHHTLLIMFRIIFDIIVEPYLLV